MNQKKCFKCGETKEIDEFYKHKAMKDGHLNKCKVCSKKDATQHRYENIERVKEYDRKRNADKARKKNKALYLKKYREKNRHKQAAHNAVARAILSGKLVRASHCQICDKEAKTEGHHWSYLPEHRLNVIWLCSQCHSDLHFIEANT